MKTVTLRPLSIGEILDGSFTLFRRHFLIIFPSILIVLLPRIPLSLLVPPVVLGYTDLPLFVLATVVAVWQMSEAALGRRPTLPGGMKKGIRMFFPALLAMILYGLIIALGMIALFIPGILLSIRYFAFLQALVLEGEKRYFRRSAALARGSWGKIFVVGLLSGLITFIPGAAVQIGTGYIFRVIQAYPRPLAPDLLTVVLGIGVQALTLPFTHGVMVLLYYDQRVRKEGLDVELAASALDDLQEGEGGAGAKGNRAVEQPGT